MPKVELARDFALKKHKGQAKSNGITTYSEHFEAVVSRLKNMGVTDEDILCTGWLHDTIENTDATFDEISEIFGKNIALLVLSLSKDESLPKKEKELNYTKLLHDASFEAKLVKLCDISANLKDMDETMSKTKKKKSVSKKLHYLRIIKNDLAIHVSEYPKILLVDGINQIAKKNIIKDLYSLTNYENQFKKTRYSQILVLFIKMKFYFCKF